MSDGNTGDSSLVRSYLNLRQSIGVIGISLPFVLAIGDVLVEGRQLQPSMSQYYHTDMRNVFVGSLFAMAVFLWSYRGYDRKDNIAGNLACLFAIGIALFPTRDETTADPGGIISDLHYVFAAGFFLTLAYFSLALFRLSDKETPTRQKLIRNSVYTACGYSILSSLGLIVVVNLLPASSQINQLRPVFWLEALAVVAFGISWFVKGEAILKDHVGYSGGEETEPRIPNSHAALHLQ